MSEKRQKADGEVEYYDVSEGVNRKGKARALSSKYSEKNTVNLCIRERKGISAELFFLILAGILLVLLLLEFFGAYQPYLRLEAAEQQLADEQAAVQAMQDSMKDYKTVQDSYREHNYEHFPRERVDREDVFQLIEEVIFDKGVITSFNLNGNTLTLSLSGVSIVEPTGPEKEGMNDRRYILTNIEKSPIVSDYDSPQYTAEYDSAGQDTGRVSFTITIVFKDAT